MILLPALAAPAEEPETKPSETVLVLRAGRVLTMEGDGLGALEPGAIRIEGGRIAAVGAEVDVPEGAEVFDLPGATILPGFVDARSALPIEPGALGEAKSPSPTFDALDGVDPFAVEAIEEAIQAGVTSVHLAAARPATVGGRTAVWKLEPRSAVKDGVVKRPAGLHASIGAARARPSSPIGRLGEFRTIQEQFRDARKYREQWEEYRAALEEYEREKKKREEEKKKAKEGEEAKKEEQKGEGEKGKTGGRGRRGGERGKAPEDEEDGSEEPGGALAAAEPQGTAQEEEEKKEEEKKDDPKEEKKDEAPKKPKKPARDPAKEILLEVLDGKYPLRLETHRAEDALNALLLAEEFEVDLVLEGVTEAARVTREIAQAGVPVVLGPPDPAAVPYSIPGERGPGTAAALAAAGVRVVLASSGADPAETRFLPLVAAHAVSEGLDRAAALRGITIEAARACGVADRLGSIAAGKDADLVVFDGDPLKPETRALAVLVGGEVAYRR